MSMTSPVESLSFENALAELEKIVKLLESGTGDLEASISAYERGVALRAHCEARLKEAESRIEKITLTPSGPAGAVPFSAGEG